MDVTNIAMITRTMEKPLLGAEVEAAQYAAVHVGPGEFGRSGLPVRT